MKHSINAISLLFLLLFVSCEKQQNEPEPDPQREKTIPELVENDLIEIVNKNWVGLADTLQYFDSTMLSKGKYKGVAPDGNYYELKVKIQDFRTVQATFTVKDSIWIKITGQFLPILLDARACDTDFQIKRESLDTTSITANKIQVKIPFGFILLKDKQPTLLYKGQKVGYLTLTEFENMDYSTGNYITVHYDNDSRTFAFYDKGMSTLVDFFRNKWECFPEFSLKSGREAETENR